jgi:hypothetical protein
VTLDQISFFGMLIITTKGIPLKYLTSFSPMTEYHLPMTGFLAMAGLHPLIRSIQSQPEVSSTYRMLANDYEFLEDKAFKKS